jgi:hypothetical protein
MLVEHSNIDRQRPLLLALMNRAVRCFPNFAPNDGQCAAGAGGGGGGWAIKRITSNFAGVTMTVGAAGNGGVGAAGSAGGNGASLPSGFESRGLVLYREGKASTSDPDRSFRMLMIRFVSCAHAATAGFAE